MLTSATVGGLVVFIGLVFLIRRMFRKRRIGRAESPPSSPLLPPMEDTMLPASIARGISQRSKASSNNSDDWGSKEGGRDRGNSIKPLNLGGGAGRFGEGYGGTPLVSPLPPVAKGGGGRDVFADRANFNMNPRRGELEGERVEHPRVFELSG